MAFFGEFFEAAAEAAAEEAGSLVADAAETATKELLENSADQLSKTDVANLWAALEEYASETAPGQRTVRAVNDIIKHPLKQAGLSWSRIRVLAKVIKDLLPPVHA